MKTIIALSGKSGCGKTTVEKYLDANLLKKPFSIQMAELLKLIVSILTGCEPRNLDYQDFKKTESNYKINDVKLTYREVLLHIADILRKDNDLIFIEYVLRHLDFINNNYVCSTVIIPDVREKQEIEHLRKWAIENGIKLIHIRINRCDNNTSQPNHKTETDLDNYDKYDAIIDNTTDNINDLYDAVDKILKQYDIKSKFNYEEPTLF